MPRHRHDTKYEVVTDGVTMTCPSYRSAKTVYDANVKLLKKGKCKSVEFLMVVPNVTVLEQESKPL